MLLLVQRIAEEGTAGENMSDADDDDEKVSGVEAHGSCFCFCCSVVVIIMTVLPLFVPKKYEAYFGEKQHIHQLT